MTIAYDTSVSCWSVIVAELLGKGAFLFPFFQMIASAHFCVPSLERRQQVLGRIPCRGAAALEAAERGRYLWRMMLCSHHIKGNLSLASKTCLAQGSFSLLPSSRTRGNGHKLKRRKFRLPREIVEPLSMEIFKACQDTVLGNVLLVTLLWGGGLN